MTDDDGDGWFDYTLVGVDCADVIFSDNGNQQTADLTGICSESWYDNGWVAEGLKEAIQPKDITNKRLGVLAYPNPFNNSLTIFGQPKLRINPSNYINRLHLNLNTILIFESF